VIEHAPFGVIGAITPVTHSLPTITGNAVSMIAAGNTLVVNPHPSGKRVAAEGVRRFNEAIHRDMGIDNLICVIAEPTLETADAIFKHRDVRLICVTGGAAVARAALNSGKRASSPDRAIRRWWSTRRPIWTAPPAASSRARVRQQPAVHRREGGVRRRQVFDR
jgi:delta 1-pyrroline-5-carboxylate dehydrogenase